MYEGNDFNLNLSRAKFEELNHDYFNKTIETVGKVLKDAQININKIDEVVLIGGSTRIPRIQQLLKELFNNKNPFKSINPDEAVA